MSGVTAERLFERVIPEPNSGCWLWYGSTYLDGYGRISPKKRLSLRAHRVSWEVHFGEIPKGMVVCHKCDVRSCINPAHLFLGTPADNNADMKRKGRAVVPIGEAHGQSKLTARQAAAVFLDGRPLSAIARDFGIRIQSVHAIKRGKNWRSVTRHLQPPSDAARNVPKTYPTTVSISPAHGLNHGADDDRTDELF